MFEGITPLHLLIVLAIALIVLGPGKLPEVGAAIGKSIREFRKAATDTAEAVRLEAGTPAAPAPPVAPSTPLPPPVMPYGPAPAIPTDPGTAAPPPPLGPPLGPPPGPHAG